VRERARESERQRGPSLQGRVHDFALDAREDGSLNLRLEGVPIPGSGTACTCRPLDPPLQPRAAPGPIRLPGLRCLLATLRAKTRAVQTAALVNGWLPLP